MFELALLEAVDSDDIHQLNKIIIKLIESNQLKELTHKYKQRDYKTLLAISLQKTELTIAQFIFNILRKVDSKNLIYSFNIALAYLICSERNDSDTCSEINHIINNFYLTQQDRKNIINYTDNDQRYTSLLYLAVATEKKVVISLLIQLGADINKGRLNDPKGEQHAVNLPIDVELESPLCLAAGKGDMKTLALLIKNGANVFLESATSFKRYSVFAAAITNEQYECAEKILQARIGLYYTFWKKEQKLLKEINFSHKIVIGINFGRFSNLNKNNLKGWNESIDTVVKLEEALKAGRIDRQKTNLLPLINACNYLLKNKQGNQENIKKVRDICGTYIDASLKDKCIFRIAFGTDHGFLLIRQQLSSQTIKKIGLIEQVKNSVSGFFTKNTSSEQVMQPNIPESLNDRIIEVQEIFNPSDYL